MSGFESAGPTGPSSGDCPSSSLVGRVYRESFRPVVSKVALAFPFLAFLMLRPGL